MSGQILFFRKNHMDLDRPNPVITVTDNVALNDGQDSIVFLRNRNNISGWVTTDSTDAANTQLLIELFDYYNIDYISLVKHNFKNYIVEYLDEALAWQTYSEVTDNVETTTVHLKDTPILSNTVRITILGTVIPDQDKEMRQLIITEKLYQFEGWPVIKKPVHSTNKKVNPMLSGKVRVVKTRGSFSTELEIKLSGNENDLAMHEAIYDAAEGMLLLLSGANESQFRTKRKGYKNEDIVLVKPVDEYTNPYNSGVYTNGIKIKMKLAESVD